MSLPLTYHGDDTENEESTFIYNYDWSTTSLGPMESWEPMIKNALHLCLQSAYPTTLYLGPELIMIFNKAFRQISKNLYKLGKSVNKNLSIPDYQRSQIKTVMTTGKGIFQKEQYAEGPRSGYKVEMYFDYTFSPIFKSDGTVHGIFNLLQEVTQKVLSVRRFKTLSEFGRWTSEIKSLDSACNIITKVLKDNNADVPYALIYFIKHKLNAGSESLIARLTATTFDEDSKKERHFPDYFPETREIIDLSKEVDNNHETYIELKRETTIHSFLKCDSWPIHLLIKKGHHVKVILKDGSQAVLLLTKIPLGGDQTLSAVLICGINRMRPLDEQYMEFLQLVANQMNTFLLHGKSIEEERERSKILADLNYQKIMFFQGISHELKTPLTLMLSPLEDVISEGSREAPIMSHLQTIRRNSRRLLKLINVLLQFSNIEANQLEANYIETDISEFTQELVSGFKNMAETLNLDFIIDIPNSSEFNHNMSDKIYLDHDMYETIVFNLCSNAIKHTWNGNIIIRLYLDNKDDKKMIVLEVSDTVGIPEVALPNIFQRFYRVESQNSRSHEGTGIGLALVKQLITRHGGDITVKSVVNKGTTFKCWFPIGCEHLPTNQIRINNVEKPINNCQELCINRQLYLEECSQWAKNNMPEAQFNRDQLSVDDDWSVGKVSTKEISSPSSTDNFAARKEHQILLIEDNDDMRNYLSVLLKEFDVINAHDGRDAIKILKKTDKLPDLILSDIMLPNMNGYELLDALRSNTKTQLIPVILLSAKADEYSKIKGLDKGAVDYLIKPFSAQELIIRIRANIEISLLRRKMILQRCKQEEITQLLLSISTELVSSSSIKETLHYIAEEIFHRLPCERIIIISNEQDEFKNNKILALFEDSTIPFVEISDTDRSESQIFTNSQEFLNNNSGITISLDVYCDDIRKNVSILSVKILLNNGFWGWIKIYRPSNSIWLDSEIEFLQQISNQISLAITYRSVLEQNNALEIQIKAAKIANNAKGQILSNTSHELRTPLGAIVGLLSSFEGTNLTVDQRDMINIMARASDDVLSIINNILDAAKLEAQKITLVNRTFDLLELFEDTIEKFGEKAGSKNIELIINYDVDKLPRYVKSDPERLKQVLFHLLSNSIKFTEEGEIILTISMLSREVIDENNMNPTNSQIIKKGVLLIELCDTGIGMDPEYIQHAWKSFSRGDMSITRRQDGTGLGLSICKSLIKINGGEINAESQLGKGSKFWFTWNIELLSSMSTISKFKTPLLSMQFNEQLIYTLPHEIRQKRILIIHPVEMMRNVILNYLKKVEKVDAFDTFDKAIRAAKAYKESHDKPAYDIVFIGVNDNAEEVVEAALELRGLEMNDNNLIIIFIVFPSNEGSKLVKRLIGKVGGSTFIIYTPITWKKLINQFMYMDKNNATYENNMNMHIDENILRRVRDYGFHKIGNMSQDIYEYIIGRDFKRKCTLGKDFNGKCILCVDNDSISLENTLQQVSKLGYSTFSATSGQEAVRLIDHEFNLLNNAYSDSSNLDMEQVNSCRISLILLECNLPIISGFDVSRAIRAMRPPISNIPIIILTNLLTEEIQNKCIELKINDFLGKPLKFEELEKVLTKWIGEN
ncbi:hypothetical protein C2G38_1348582 [Gigaspora rosea]|uniref:histidine kinase n=1 Tax=Gigaspora rosea TaxID=44941 RepID=A0A397W263_9GLOM|nr:hypothetical protein C2G38_1348582 [Gigaspora rosea]